MAAKKVDPHLLLFDIDGTLILSGGAGEAALADAMRDRFGVEENFDGIILAGATDARIAHLLLAKHGIEETPENVTALLDSYLHFLEGNLPRFQGTVLPGIVALLEALRGREDVVLALLTGNLARGAELKLTHYGVWDFFEFGAFADDHSDRNQLGHFARSRAEERHGEQFPAERIYVIGDTPKDIECGRAIGAKTVAIATGIYPEDVLREYRPDYLFKDLADVQQVVDSLLTPGS